MLQCDWSSKLKTEIFNMEVVVGTYNHVLFGFKFLKYIDKDEKETWQLDPLFTDQNHAGLIKSVGTGGRYVASGSSDETIKLFDMKKHIEIGTLVQQSGTITSIVFCGSSHMLSGSEDGTICIWKCKTWELEKTLKGHRGAINCLSMHPSGRLVLSVSKDKTIKTWNLLTGRAAYTTSLKEVGELVLWSPSGDAYAIVVGVKVTVYKISGVDEPVVYRCEKYILAAEFVNNNVLLLAGESEDIIVYNFSKEIVLQRLTAHKTRTKGVSVVKHPEDETKNLLFTVASDGNLKAWSFDVNNLEEDFRLLASIDLPGRPTCLTVKLPTSNTNTTLKKLKENVSGGDNLEQNDEDTEESDDNEKQQEEVVEKGSAKKKKRAGINVDNKKKMKKKKSAGD